MLYEKSEDIGMKLSSIGNLESSGSKNDLEIVPQLIF